VELLISAVRRLFASPRGRKSFIVADVMCSIRAAPEGMSKPSYDSGLVSSIRTQFTVPAKRSERNHAGQTASNAASSGKHTEALPGAACGRGWGWARNGQPRRPVRQWAGLAGPSAARHSLVLLDFGRDRTTERSGVVRASGNEVFAPRHKTGTRQCLVVPSFGWRGHRRVVRSATCGGPGLGVGGHQLTEEGTEERSKHPATRATALHGILWVFFLFS
jgi:hypothetical protein